MGFLDTLKKAGSSTYDALQKNAAEVEVLKDRLDSYSDERLFSEIRSGSYQKKTACSLLLQERGYSREEVVAAMKGRK